MNQRGDSVGGLGLGSPGSVSASSAGSAALGLDHLEVARTEDGPPLSIPDRPSLGHVPWVTSQLAVFPTKFLP